MVSRPVFCTGGPDDREHRQGCECYIRPPRLTLRPSLENFPRHYDRGREIVHLPMPPLAISESDWFYHRGCVCNHINALLGRVGACVPYPNQVARVILNQRAAALAKRVGKYPQISLQEVVNCFSGMRRRRYEQALADYRLRGYRNSDAKVQMFVKLEGIKFSSKKVNPSCRAIQWRKPVYTLLLGSFIKPIEHSLYNVAGGSGFPKTRFIAKCLTPKQRAKLLRRKFDSLPGCTAFMLDASRFDAHITEELLDVEGVFWRACNSDPLFSKLLKQQLVNKGVFVAEGKKVNYKVRGGRMSGDGNTAAGNCVIMSCLLSAFGLYIQRISPDARFDFLCDGDDSVFFIVGYVPTRTFIERFFLNFGMTMKVDSSTKIFQKINFCQGAPVRVAGEWTLARDPFKIVSKTTINPKFAIKSLRPKLLKTIAVGELSIYHGVPVVDSYLRALIRSADSHMSNRGKRDGGLLKSGAWKEYRHLRDMPSDWFRIRSTPITPQARSDFSQAWGISVSDQLSIEELLSKWECNPFAFQEQGDPVSKNLWRFDWRHPERPV